MRKNKQLAHRAREEEKRRDAVLSELEKNMATLMKARDGAKAVVADCLSLINSIKRTPIEVPLKSHAVIVEQKKFKRSDEIVRKQYGRESIALS